MNTSASVYTGTRGQRFRSARPWNLIELWRQRQALRRLDEDRLGDLGISQEDALTEATRPMWNVPQHWLR